MINDEIWKHVVDFEGFYEVSNYGNVRSVDSIRMYGDKKKKFKGKLLKQYSNKNGYKVVTLCVNKRYKKPLVHRLVAEAFLKNGENKKSVNHIDGVPSNNKVNNLEWCTALENNLHALETGLKKASIRENKVKIIEDYRKGMTIKGISKKYGCCKNALSKLFQDEGVELRRGGYTAKRYHIDKQDMVKRFENNEKNKDIAVLYDCPNTLIATYRKMYKKGELIV